MLGVKSMYVAVTYRIYISTLDNLSSKCVKVLRLWLERKILPESIIRRHIRELDTYSSLAVGGAFSRRSLRTERALDDPVREMEGMLVDEYGRFVFSEEFFLFILLFFMFHLLLEVSFLKFCLILQ